MTMRCRYISRHLNGEYCVFVMWFTYILIVMCAISKLCVSIRKNRGLIFTFGDKLFIMGYLPMSTIIVSATMGMK